MLLPVPAQPVSRKTRSSAFSIQSSNGWSSHVRPVKCSMLAAMGFGISAAIAVTS